MAPSWYWVLDLIAGGLALWLIPIVYAAGPRRASNRFLAVVLFFDAAIWAGIGATALTSGPSALGIGRVVEVAAWVVPWLYVLFVTRAVDTVWTRPLRGRGMTMALGIVTAAAFLGGLLTDGGFWRELIVTSTNAGSAVYALVVSATAWRSREIGSMERKQWRFFTIAFAARDIGWLVIQPLVKLFEARGMPSADVLAWSETLWFIPWLVFITALAYGIMTGALPELRPSVRVRVSRNTAVAIVAITFLVLTETLEALLQVDDPIIATAVAVLLFVAILPIQRTTERMAGRLVPT